MKVICLDRGVVILLVIIPAFAYFALTNDVTSFSVQNVMPMVYTAFHLVVLFVITFILFQLTMVPRLSRIPDFAIHNCKITQERRPSKTGVFISRAFVIFQLGSLYFVLYWLSVKILGLSFFAPYGVQDE